jgi:hypothetical protein
MPHRSLRIASALLLAALPFSVAGQQAPAPAATYQMDLFSIISFALAIAALIVSVFLGWLSWEFYKKSAEASEKSQQAVTKIETAVLSIQSEITEIVRRAVGYWTGGGSQPDSPDTSALTQKLEELTAQVAAVSGSAANKEELEAKVAELARLQREQIANWNASVVEAKARAIFPGIADRGPVAESTHTVTVNTEKEMSGQILIAVQRPSRVVTVTTRFTPPFQVATGLTASVVDAPSGRMDHVRVNSGIGKFGDFNVHLHPVAAAGAALVEPGTYVVEYKATADGTPGA